ncbi:hypothetical protein A2856_02825 [Candidatus Uhrbacteria bacterium RIFCSPHIGHO2_01_FULL_63_20]|uniref:Uncharacterized protein n=1 Tax=Candidatus Uhrbacteria bacterium RIFCSPHIGHO2_01_FULL_63_20 TaxID=1802385 RepID=A0A1F7TKT2_9BACT|nr:MAG: hypothetical protein A2856_02825 [Candidatus Uhrbacteria bacterium RIFCSPHIGHO2_01_FULL_63_20]
MTQNQGNPAPDTNAGNEEENEEDFDRPPSQTPSSRPNAGTDILDDALNDVEQRFKAARNQHDGTAAVQGEGFVMMEANAEKAPITETTPIKELNLESQDVMAIEMTEVVEERPAPPAPPPEDPLPRTGTIKAEGLGDAIAAGEEAFRPLPSTADASAIVDRTKTPAFGTASISIEGAPVTDDESKAIRDDWEDVKTGEVDVEAVVRTGLVRKDSFLDKTGRYQKTIEELRKDKERITRTYDLRIQRTELREQRKKLSESEPIRKLREEMNDLEKVLKPANAEKKTAIEAAMRNDAVAKKATEKFAEAKLRLGMAVVAIFQAKNFDQVAEGSKALGPASLNLEAAKMEELEALAKSEAENKKMKEVIEKARPLKEKWDELKAQRDKPIKEIEGKIAKIDAEIAEINKT